jgi:hypothetical protein
MDYQKISDIVEDLRECIKMADVLKGRFKDDWYFEPKIVWLKETIKDVVRDLEEM